MTETDQPIKVRLEPVADVDALRKYHREYYHNNKQECECEHCHSKVHQRERSGPAPAIRAEVPPAKSKG